MSEGERRRHPRRVVGVEARVELIDGGGPPTLTGAVVDVSAGGVLLELPPGASPPPLGVRARITLVRDAQAVLRGARVVRLRLAGRARGHPLPRTCAWVFDDGDEDAARRLARLLAAGA